MKLGSDTLRTYEPTPEEISSIERKPVYIIVENVLDTYNVGAIFRLADAAAVSCVYLVGDTATPDDPLVGHKIHKSSVGTWRWTPWKYCKTVGEAVDRITNYLPAQAGELRDKQTLQVIAIEQHEKSVDYSSYNYTFPIAFIVGHETTGISKEALALADSIVEIPMFGVNKSLNVMVSLAIVLWKGMER